MKRIVSPEILDSLDSDDPAAIRSRKDLRMINWFMRGEAWIMSQLEGMENLQKVVEIGAGNGHLAMLVKKKFPHVNIVAIDLLEKPAGVSDEVEWLTEDVLESDHFDENCVVVANLFIHHLSQENLSQLGKKILNCQALILAEPHRCWFSKLLGYLLFPFINYVTKHDMITSIDAGFKLGELGRLLGMNRHWQEKISLGGIRWIAKKPIHKSTNNP